MNSEWLLGSRSVRLLGVVDFESAVDETELC